MLLPGLASLAESCSLTLKIAPHLTPLTPTTLLADYLTPHFTRGWMPFPPFGRRFFLGQGILPLSSGVLLHPGVMLASCLHFLFFLLLRTSSRPQRFSAIPSSVPNGPLLAFASPWLTFLRGFFFFSQPPGDLGCGVVFFFRFLTRFFLVGFAFAFWFFFFWGWFVDAHLSLRLLTSARVLFPPRGMGYVPFGSRRGHPVHAPHPFCCSFPGLLLLFFSMDLLPILELPVDFCVFPLRRISCFSGAGLVAGLFFSLPS